METLFLIAAEAPGDGGLIARFGVDWQFFVSQLIAFLVVAGLLWKYAFQPVLDMLESRRERIAAGMAKAKQADEELARTQADRKEILQKANDRADALIEEARAVAARIQDTESQKAVTQAEQILTRAREAAEADKARMMAELKQDLGGLVVNATAQVVGKVLTPEDRKRLVEETARQMAG